MTNLFPLAPHIGLNTEAPTCLKQGQYPHIAVRRVSSNLLART